MPRQLLSSPPRSNVPRIALLDEHPQYLESLALFLRQQPCIALAGCFQQARALSAALESGIELDAVLVSHHVDGDDESGLSLLRAVAGAHPRLRVLAVTLDEVPLLTCCALNAGAAAVLNTVSDWPSWRLAIDCTVRQGRYLSPRDNEWQQSIASLAAAECGVLHAAAEGLGTGVLAHRLGISEKTLSSHKRAAYRKTGLCSDLDLYRWSPVVMDMLQHHPNMPRPG